tara:strand:- start:1884 stop:2768 length:885 start_codon:yes stop_codon:yes gene_type:complete
MKALWIVSFRPFGKSKENDTYQGIFINSIKSLNFDITFSLTQFDEPNIEEFINKKSIKNFYTNISKKELPDGKKYSNKRMLDNALDQYMEKSDFEYLVYSNADIIVPNNLFDELVKIKLKNFCAIIYPNTHVKNGNIKNIFWPHYGIDLIIFKISKDKAIKFKELIKTYEAYDWGLQENFYIAASEALNLKRINLFKKTKVIKFENDFLAFDETRNTQIKAWQENQKYFLKFLKANKLSKLYASGSYYYLLYKIFRFRDLNFGLILSYIIFYPYNLTRKIFSLIKKFLSIDVKP